MKNYYDNNRNELVFLIPKIPSGLNKRKAKRITKAMASL